MKRIRRLDRSGERGSALLEFSIAAGFLLIVALGIIDLGRYFNTYLTASRLVYEVARFTASEPGLRATRTSWAGRPEEFVLTPNKVNARAANVPTSVQERAERMLNQHVLSSIKVRGNVKFRYSLVNNPAPYNPQGAKRNDTGVIEIGVEIPFESFAARIFNVQNVRSSVRIAYLFD